MPKDAAPAAPAIGGPSFGGGVSAGIVIVPEKHPDAEPWPKGMVIKPPDVNDPMAIIPGTDQMPEGRPRASASWSRSLADVVGDGIGTLFELILPNASM